MSALRMVAASLIAVVAIPAWAVDVPVTARIDEVKVYSEGASVTRRSQITIPAGTNRLVFTGLPASIDTDTLRIAVANRDVRLGAIEVERITDKEFVNAQEREMRERLQKLNDQVAALQDDIATAETQLKLIDSLATTPAGTGSKAAVDATALSSVLTTMSTSAAAARSKVREAKLRQREINKDIEKTNADLQKIATARKQTYEVRAFIESPAAVDAAVSVEYAMEDAEWSWVYEARLDTVAKRVTLSRQASVEQSSGEDWKNATLTLTTARPSEDAATPEVASLFLDLAEKEANRRRAAAPASDEMQEIVVTGTHQLHRAPVTIIQTDYLAEYRIPGRVTLDSDGEPRLYPVAEEQVDVTLRARIVPTASQSAFLEALFRYEGSAPIQGGELQLYRDGAFVGRASIESMLPGEDVHLPFGADERIQVVVRDEPKQSGDRGLVSKTRVDEHKQRFEITNYHSMPIALEVVDRIPVAQNKDIRVEALKGATDPTTRDLDGQSGVMLWQITAQPRQTATIRHYYSVRYPADQILSRHE
ncbi:uncharacterized protein (TIGR02231 family) [Povalibacter uvarum]|uniref:Uncharacterized protein (TIGR02231 family) n=1 Tax=Povalibacter uvarum TaxID=732238 RepID=A0A841HKU8_9GAMM|nr:mucoidy inhibitor MuiA family protein [Povalibacter uvarum]MBB6092920.1 uncharacterized protein (TIGR02231 family) [Povalibacter uvarum]